MARKLGDVTLETDARWIDAQQSVNVLQSLRMAVSGDPVISAQPIRTRTITLDPGWLDETRTNRLLTMASTAGATFVLEWDGTFVTVMFRHHEPPAVELQPILPGEKIFEGTIRLLQV